MRDKTKNEARRRSRRDFSATTPIIKIVVITASHCRRAFTSALLCPPKLGGGLGRPPFQITTPSKNSGVSFMEYKGFYVEAFEREPGKWRANIRRIDGKPVKVIGRERLEKSVTKFDATTEIAAKAIAMEVIDAGTFVRQRVATEKFCRRRRHGAARARLL